MMEKYGGRRWNGDDGDCGKEREKKITTEKQ